MALATIGNNQGKGLSSTVIHLVTNVTSYGEVDTLAQGHCYNTTGNPTLSDNHSDDMVNNPFYYQITSMLTGLTPNTIYYIKAYITNVDGTSYGTEFTGKTQTRLESGFGFGLWYNRAVASHPTKTVAPQGWHVPVDNDGVYEDEFSLKLFIPTNYLVKKLLGVRQVVSGTTITTDIQPTWAATTVQPPHTPMNGTDEYGFAFYPNGGINRGISEFLSGNKIGSLWFDCKTTYGTSALVLGEGINHFVKYNTYEIDNGQFSGIRLVKDDATGWVEGDTMTDYEGNVYKTCKVGDYVWMAENLRTKYFSDGTPINQYINPVNGHPKSNAPVWAYVNGDSYLEYIPLLDAGVLSESQVICHSGTPSQPELLTSVNASGGTAPYTYQWYSGTTSAATDVILGATGSTYQPPVVTVDTWYRKQVVDSAYTPQTVYTNTVKITPSLIPIIADDQEFNSTSEAVLDYKILGSNFTNPQDNIKFIYNVVTNNVSGAVERQIPSSDDITDTLIGDGDVTYIVTPINADGCEGEAKSISIKVKDLAKVPQSFCAVQAYTTKDSACGFDNGSITITYPYFHYYNFVLTDIDGNTYPISTQYFDNLPANWYFLQATPKPEYAHMLNYDPCSISWIAIHDVDSPTSLTSVSVKQPQCQPFDKETGRIWYSISGISSTNTTYDFKVFKEDTTLYYSETGLTTAQEFIVNNIASGCYYGYIENKLTGCKMLLDIQCIQSNTVFNQGGLKSCYLTEYTDNIDINYWKTSDEDYFLEFEDESFFTSTKIKEIKSTAGIQWYKINVLPKVFKLTQKVDKVRQGFIFSDVLTLAIPRASAIKWNKINRLINPNTKWIVVVQDNNNFWWCFGYIHGAKVELYQFKTGLRGDDNGYSLTFSSISENKLLTNIDETFVINNIK